MKRVAHFVEKFPAPGNDYIYEQLVNNPNIESLLISEWLISKDHPYTEIPFYFRKYSRINFLNRINLKLNDSILNKTYIQKYNDYVRYILEKHQVSIMHAHFGMAGYKLVGLRKKLNIPLVVTFYGVDASYCLKQKNWRERYKELFRLADVLIVLCEEVRDRFISFGCAKEKIKVWDIGIRLQDFPYQKRLPSKSTKFLTVARFVEKKGYFVLLDAFRKMLDTRKNISLTLIGHGPFKNKILNRIKAFGIDNYVTLIDTAKSNDFEKTFKGALASHDIFVLPSIVARNGDDEGGPPIVITNAQACGLPVISTPVGGIPRAVRDNETGFLCRPNDAGDLAQKMFFLIENNQLWNSMGQRARLFIENNFSLTEQLKKLERVYLSL